MGRPLKWTPEQKLPLVLSVLRGEGSVAEIGRRHRVSDVTLAKWRDAFLAGGAAALANGRQRGQSSREAELEAELEEIKAALGEAHAELLVWRKKGAIYPAVTRATPKNRRYLMGPLPSRPLVASRIT